MRYQVTCTQLGTHTVSGGTRVGRIVAEAAAKHLTPVTLEVSVSILLVVRID